MLNKTRAIVLHHLKFGDTSLVTTMYTEYAGRISFIVNGVYGRRSKFPPTLFQSFTLLDLEVYHNPKRELQRVKEITLNLPLHSVAYQITKNTIALFLCEILYKILKEEEANPSLFSYLYHSIEVLDVKETGIANFHLVFLINLTKYLGFYPSDNYSEERCIFDPVNGQFIRDTLLPPDYPDKTMSLLIHRLLNSSFERMESISMNHQVRNKLVSLIIEYFNHHLGGPGNVKSLAVLQSVFEDN